jgi:hypothetical protein
MSSEGIDVSASFFKQLLTHLHRYGLKHALEGFYRGFLKLTLPRSPLSLDRKPPLFFTATSSVLLCTSGSETLKSKLKWEQRAY